VIQDNSIPDLFSCVDAETFRVHAPSSVIFLCGGKLDVAANPAPSLREAFTRVAGLKDQLKKYSVIMAEEVNGFFPDGQYQDILTFESDLAQLSELIILFSESMGAAAELGAFASVEEISSKLMVVIDDEMYGERSFITLGPIRRLEIEYRAAVCVLHRADINIDSIRNVSRLDVDIFGDRLNQAIKSRTRESREHTTFSRNRIGHVIKLIVGIVQHYGALTLDEIMLYLAAYDIDASRDKVVGYLLCAKAVKWLHEERRGIENYFAATSGNEALQYDLRAGVPQIDKLRWKTQIREYWRSEDPDRYNVIRAGIAVSAK